MVFLKVVLFAAGCLGVGLKILDCTGLKKDCPMRYPAGLDTLERRLRQEGITHLYYHYSDLKRHSGYHTFEPGPREAALWKDFAARRLEPIYRDDEALVIYRLF